MTITHAATILPALALVLAGCSGASYCDRSAEYVESCGTTTMSNAQIRVCEDSLEPCSAADEQTLVDFVDCLDDASGGNCDSTGTATAFSMFACFGNLGGVSEECLASAGLGFSTYSTTYTTTTY